MPMLNRFLGLYEVGKSLKRSPVPFPSTRLLPLGAIGIPPYVYGDEATLGFIDSLCIVWGDTVPAAWDSLQAGWLWDWHLSDRHLEIIDANGHKTTRQADTWSDLLVSMEVLESHQFRYILDADNEPSPFIIVSRPVGVLSSFLPAYLWGLNGSAEGGGTYEYVQQGRTFWLVDSEDGTLPTLTFTLSAMVDEKSEAALMANITADLAAAGIYPLNLKDAAPDIVAGYQRTERQGNVAEFGRILFWAYATASLFLNDDYESGPCYEPWMLWQMWKWLQKYQFSDISGKIFDLSPNWGNT